MVVASLICICAYVYGTFTPNSMTLDKLKEKYTKALIVEWNSYGFNEPAIEYSTDLQFVQGVQRCVDFLNLHTEPHLRIPRDIIIAMAVLETGYGTSRFAKEANNLFGIRTWNSDIPQLKAKENPKASWGVRKYKTKCGSVKHMITTINTHRAYKEFRLARAKLRDDGLPLDSIILSEYLNEYAETGEQYVETLKKIIKQNDLKDFGNARLLPSSLELESLT